MIPLSLYIHFPWCIQKCPYCDFNSHKNNPDLYKPYLTTLIDDVIEILPHIWGRSISSVFIGGGTPSLIPPDALAELFSHLRRYLTFTTECEVTLEANPGTLDRRYFQGYHELGVNRLSIGVQTLDDLRLKKIGRIHSAAEAIEAIEEAQRVGFKELNCDLMFGLPGQDLKGALQDLERIISYEPTHISHYQLTLEPNTYFYHYKPELPPEEVIEKMQLLGHQLLATSGYHQYEVSAFAKPGFTSRHNLNYWQFGDYIGIGAGAHGKITKSGEGRIIRTWLERHPRTYIEKSGKDRIHYHTVSKEELPFEFFMNGLRIKSGIPTLYWEERTLLPLTTISEELNQLLKEGLIKEWDQQIVTTERGFLFLNQILERFL